MKGRERLNKVTFRWKTAVTITVEPVGVFQKSERARLSLGVTEYRSRIGIVRVDFERDHPLATAPDTVRGQIAGAARRQIRDRLDSPFSPKIRGGS